MKIKLFIIEDDYIDLKIIKNIIKNSEFDFDVTISNNGDDAINKLKNGYIPDIVFLDLSLPIKTGDFVLGYIKSILILKYIPVITISSSVSIYDIKKMYSMGANLYIVKDTDIDKFQTIIYAILNVFFKFGNIPICC